MHRFYLPPEQCQGPSLVLAGREAHHALHVLRVRRGDHVIVVDGVGRELVCHVQEPGRDKVTLTVIEQKQAATKSCPITLLQALPKGKTIEDIIEKATELGAARIVPLLSERVVAQIDASAAAAKAEKWRWVAVDAIKQCGSAWLPRIETPITPRDFLARAETFELALIASLAPGSCHPRLYFNRFREDRDRLPASVCVWIGPEGDFTAEEIDVIQAAGAQPITLGPLVLRSETAAIYCLSVVNYELGFNVPAPAL